MSTPKPITGRGDSMVITDLYLSWFILGLDTLTGGEDWGSLSKEEGILQSRWWVVSAMPIPVPTAPLLEHKENKDLQAPSTTHLPSHPIYDPSSCTLEPSPQGYHSPELITVLPISATFPDFPVPAKGNTIHWSKTELPACSMSISVPVTYQIGILWRMTLLENVICKKRFEKYLRGFTWPLAVLPLAVWKADSQQTAVSSAWVPKWEIHGADVNRSRITPR